MKVTGSISIKIEADIDEMTSRRNFLDGTHQKEDTCPKESNQPYLEPP
jgi:hypothetical protein